MASVYLETYGCQMNEYDSELVKTILGQNGHPMIKRIEEAEVILLNTCAVRENAYNKIYARVGDLKVLRNSKKTRIGILGCMAQNLKDSLLAKNKNVDFVVGPDNYKQLPKLIQKALNEKPGSQIITDLSEYETYSDIAPSRDDGFNAWIAIMRGCDNFCTFCVVPYTRGRERSRSLDSILEEARQAISAGKKQITLLGQNVNSYKSDKHTFADLMSAISELDRLERVRFTSPHPLDFPEELIDVIASHDKLCKQIHLPLQAGNNEVLRRMNRGYTRETFIDIADMIRQKCPEAHITTDIIVGFPGESESQFEETKEVMDRVQFESAYIFKYSPRQGTLASKKFADDVPEAEKTRRIVELNAMQKKLTESALDKLLGKTVEIMIESETTPLSDQQCQGRIDQGAMVVLAQNGQLKKGQLVRVQIHSRTSHVLLGENAEKSVHA